MVVFLNLYLSSAMSFYRVLTRWVKLSISNNSFSLALLMRARDILTLSLEYFGGASFEMTLNACNSF